MTEEAPSSEYNVKTISLFDAKRLVGLKISAYEDYLAARVLFNSNLLTPACYLANTCIEKELKAYLEIRGYKTPDRHNSFDLYTMIDNRIKDHNIKIDKGFLRILSKIYKSRYTEKLSPGYNFVVLKNKFLAELDYVYSILESKERFQLQPPPYISKTTYEEGIEEKDIRLLSNNHILLKIDKTDYLNRVETIYEYRIVVNHEIFQITYNTRKSNLDNNFEYVGIFPQSDNKSYYVSHMEDGTLNPNIPVQIG